MTYKVEKPSTEMADAVQAQASCNAENGKRSKRSTGVSDLDELGNGESGTIIIILRHQPISRRVVGGHQDPFVHVSTFRRKNTTTRRWRERGDDEANAASNIKISQ